MESLFNKVAGLQMLACKYREISKNTNFEELLQTAACVSSASKIAAFNFTRKTSDTHK